MSRPARLAVGVVSAGRVGSVLGAALARAGHRVVAASGISQESVRRATELLPGVPLLPPDEVARGADLVLLALPDDALAGMTRGLVAADAIRAGQIVVHTSGAHGVDVLAPAAEAGALPLALAIREQADSGSPTVVAAPESEAAGLYREVARQVAVSVAQKAKDFSAKFPTITVSKNT